MANTQWHLWRVFASECFVGNFFSDSLLTSQIYSDYIPKSDLTVDWETLWLFQQCHLPFPTFSLFHKWWNSSDKMKKQTRDRLLPDGQKGKRGGSSKAAKIWACWVSTQRHPEVWSCAHSQPLYKVLLGSPGCKRKSTAVLVTGKTCGCYS